MRENFLDSREEVPMKDAIKKNPRAGVFILSFLFLFEMMSVATEANPGKGSIQVFGGHPCSPAFENKSKGSNAFEKALTKCVSEETGIVFACDPAWHKTHQGNKMTVIINAAPRIEMILEEDSQKLHFMSELSRRAFESMGRYEDGFHLEHLTHCGRETIKINGYLFGQPNTRVSDFYLIDHAQLHFIRFAVDPKESWDEYKWLIKRIIDSVSFLKSPSIMPLRRGAVDENCEDKMTR